MYCTDFICTYKQHTEQYQDGMYRSQLLQAFSIKEWNDDIINRETEKIYCGLKDNNDIKRLLSKIENTPELQHILAFMGYDDSTLFKMLFRFELFDLTHKLLCGFMNDNSISKDIIDNIEKLL